MTTETENNDVEQVLLTSKQAADYLGYSLASIRASRYTGILSGVDAPTSCKIGNKTIRYLKSDLDDWVTKNARAQA